MGLLGKSTASAVVGLDIGTELIKVAEAKMSKGAVQITGLGVSPTPVGSIDNSVVVDPKALGAAVKQLLREAGIKTKTVVSSISGQSSVVVRVIEVPKMTRDELAETMKWEVERHVPFAPTEIVMDFAPIEKPNTPPDAQSMEVLLAVAQDEAVNTHVETLFAAGLMPLAIDVQPLAVSRALIDLGNGSMAHTVAVINIGSTTTDVGVFEDGLLAFPGPPLPIAGVNFTRAISEALGVPIEEADRLKKELATIDTQTVHSIGVSGAPDGGFTLGDPSLAYEPTSFDTSYPQPEDAVHDAETGTPDYQAPAGSDADAGSDFSPFDFGPGAPAQEQPVAKPADDVFDLGGPPEQPSDFKPVFDLEEPEPAGAPPAPSASVDAGAQAQPEAPADWTQPDYQAQQPMSDDVPVAQPYDIDLSVSDAITPVLMELATEIRRSLDYYTTRYQRPLDQIFLCGGTARMRGLDKFLANELGVPVVVADPLSNLTVNCPKYSAQYLSDVSPFFPVSVGLAIREMLE